MSDRQPTDPVTRRARHNALLLAAFVGVLLLPAPLNLVVVAALGAAAVGRAAGAASRSRGAGRAGGARFGGWPGSSGQRGGRAPELPPGPGDRPVVPLGVAADGAPVALSDAQLAAHGLILGASGSGKTTTLLSILGARIARGAPVVMIDLKGSPDVARQLAAAAEANGRRLRVWSPDGGERWNPLRYGNATELKDKVIATERFTEPHYQRAAELYVQTAINVLKARTPDRELTLTDLVAVMDPPRLQVMLRDLPAAHAQEVSTYLGGLTRDQLSGIRGLGTRLALLTTSQTGEWLAGGSDAIDVRDALDGGEVILFSLNASRYPGLAAQLGTVVVQDLVAASAERLERITRSGERLPLATVAIDEFSALGRDHLGQLVARGREAGIGALISTQEIADMASVAPGFADQVVGSTALKIIHRQDVPASARFASELGGTEQAWDVSYRGSGIWGNDPLSSHRHLVDRPIVPPELIRSLPTGQAVVITKVPDSQTRVVQVSPAPDATGGRQAGGGREADGRSQAGGGREATGGRQAGGGRQATGGREASGGHQATAGPESTENRTAGPRRGARRVRDSDRGARPGDRRDRDLPEAGR